MSPMVITNIRFWLGVQILSGLTVVGAARAFSPAAPGSQTRVAARSYQTELLGRRYRLDSSTDLDAYIRALETALGTAGTGARRAGPDSDGAASPGCVVNTAGDARDSVICALPPRPTQDRKLRRAIEETRDAALALRAATGAERRTLLDNLYIMAGAIRASNMRLLPGDMDLLTVLANMHQLRHAPVGLGRSGPATNLARMDPDTDPSLVDPSAPSSFWTRPESPSELDLYYAFRRTRIPSLEGEVCTYAGPKSGMGVHGGFDIRSSRFKRAKIKFGKQYSQPFAQRIFWALGFHTVPADYVPVVKVKWDQRIFTEFNMRKDERFRIKLFGLIPVHTEHLQHYLDPFEPVSEVVMLDTAGKEVTVRPEPNWDAFKNQLFKRPASRPETIKSNFNEAFAARIQYLVYRGVNLQLKNETEYDDEIHLGNWDWNGEGYPGLRETRGAVFLAAWLNEYDPSVANNRLTMTRNGSERVFTHYIYDVGVCLGRADDSPRMEAQSPNAFPWVFTRLARPGETGIPLDGSYHPIKRNRAFEAAGLQDARWMGRCLAQLTAKQLLEALVASGMPSAHVRLYYNKLANRRNQALTDLGLDCPPLRLMDSTRDFDYDPRMQGAVTITTCQGKTVAAPDEGWVVVKGRVVRRGQDAE